MSEATEYRPFAHRKNDLVADGRFVIIGRAAEPDRAASSRVTA
jgi:hypothetical protein